MRLMTSLVLHNLRAGSEFIEFEIVLSRHEAEIEIVLSGMNPNTERISNVIFCTADPATTIGLTRSRAAAIVKRSKLTRPAAVLSGLAAALLRVEQVVGLEACALRQ